MAERSQEKYTSVDGKQGATFDVDTHTVEFRGGPDGTQTVTDEGTFKVLDKGLGSGGYKFGTDIDGGHQALVGGNKKTMATSMNNIKQNGFFYLGIINTELGGANVVMARTEPRQASVPDLPGVPSPRETQESKPVVRGGRVFIPDISKGSASDENKEFIGFDLPIGPRGFPKMDNLPSFAFTPSQPSAEKQTLGGEGKLCITNVCNSDVGNFSERGDPGSYILSGNGVRGWSPFPLGDSNPRFCISGKGCVINWELPESTFSINGHTVTQKAIGKALSEKLTSNPAILESGTVGVSLDQIKNRVKLDIDPRYINITGGYGL